MHLMDKNEGLFELNKIFFFNILKRYFDERILRFSKFLLFLNQELELQSSMITNAKLIL